MVPPRTPTVDFGLKCLGRALLDARRRAGYSQSQLAWISGIHQSTISRVERGRLDGMRLRRLAVLIAALGGISIDLAAERQNKWLWLAEERERHPELFK
jgi:transcriptional regulator with XRE-family HTH domain